MVRRYFMHAKSGSLADRATHLNKLHVQHHIDTHKDMTMKDGFDLHALYFHFPNTAGQVLLGSAILAALNASLALDIPATWMVASSTLFAVTHSLLWNTLHLDMHEISEQLSDGVPCASYQRRGLYQQYVQWAFDNHTTHHDIGGGANYNVVCPGPDLLLGTYLERSRSVQL